MAEFFPASWTQQAGLVMVIDFIRQLPMDAHLRKAMLHDVTVAADVQMPAAIVQRVTTPLDLVQREAAVEEVEVAELQVVEPVRIVRDVEPVRIVREALDEGLEILEV